MIELKSGISETTIAATKAAVEDAIDAAYEIGYGEIPSTFRADVSLNIVASRAAGGTKKYDFQTTLHAYNATAVHTTMKNNLAPVFTEWEDTITESGLYNSVDSVVGGITIRPDNFIDTRKTWGDNTGDNYPGATSDILIYEANPNTGYDGVYIAVGCGNAPDKVNRTVIYFDIKSDLEALGATSVDSAILYLNVDTMSGSHTVSAYRILISPGAPNWNSPWNTPGCEATSDVAGEGGDYDRRATAESSDSTHVLDSYSTILDLTNLAQMWLAGTASEYGVLLQSDNEAVNNWVRWHQVEDPDGERPYLDIIYSLS